MTFADKPWRPADHPRPGPSWGGESNVTRFPVVASTIKQLSDRADLRTGLSGVTPFTSLPGPSPAERASDSAGIIAGAERAE